MFGWYKIILGSQKLQIVIESDSSKWNLFLLFAILAIFKFIYFYVYERSL